MGVNVVLLQCYYGVIVRVIVKVIVCVIVIVSLCVYLAMILGLTSIDYDQMISDH